MSFIRKLLGGDDDNGAPDEPNPTPPPDPCKNGHDMKIIGKDVQGEDGVRYPRKCSRCPETDVWGPFRTQHQAQGAC